MRGAGRLRSRLQQEERDSMFTTSGLYQRLKSAFRGECGAGGWRWNPVRRRWARQPGLEALEERRVPSAYRVVNMGSLGGSAGIVLDINSKGAVVGGSLIANNAAEHAFVFSHGRMRDLETLGGANSRAFGINDSGAVVGLSNTQAGSTQTAIFLDRGGHMTNLGAVDPTRPFGDIKINNKGDIIGFALADGDAALERRGTMIDVGELAGFGSAARALNNKDQVVGFSGVSQTGSNVNNHAFLYSGGKMIDLGTLGGANSTANDINDHGAVVGVAQTASGAFHGFLYTHGHMTDLGTLGGPTTVPGAINNSGEIVGGTFINANTAVGFLYKHGKMINLNSLVPASSNVFIDNAEDINDNGQIAALGISKNPQDHNEYLLLLSPTGGRR
jgi:probable HAF family extracellular repeat protein